MGNKGLFCPVPLAGILDFYTVTPYNLSMTLDEIKEKVLEIKPLHPYIRIGRFRASAIYMHEVTTEGVSTWGYFGEGNARQYGKHLITWKDLTEDELAMFRSFVKLRY